ncbi:hypothetical protein [Methylobacterium sp. yr596]|uniref:hypothetical protein n=1 Tax=Methylobacterium sp. yr596 TaxID=1761800 RepID=UPI0008E6DD64|nr:hypothetical protein [Methylobacterium sp. yr596]SFF17177.1 hypothetical protein SAMN04487844_11115 [Methylobacterium sp. yr596]
MSIARQITYFGQTAVVVCDAKCNKAWGRNRRPKVQFGDDPDDYAFLADDELGEAPTDPGTYEGSHGKPTTPAERLNKWCVRECERLGMSEPAEFNEVTTARDFSRRSYNMPWLHKGDQP